MFRSESIKSKVDIIQENNQHYINGKYVHMKDSKPVSGSGYLQESHCTQYY